jgi:phosphotransferase system  glucose/maltose/N-acetylglucosamine-specific IIC component
MFSKILTSPIPIIIAVGLLTAVTMHVTVSLSIDSDSLSADLMAVKK